MMEGSHLAALVASRVCHDLVEPMSAIIQGMEMLKHAEANGRNADALALVEHGVTKAWAKLEFFRFAFAGAHVQGDGELEEARATAERLYASLKPAFEWGAPRVAMPRAAVRVVMNLLMIANECLPRGGVVRLEAGPGDEGTEIRIVAEGPRVRLKPETAAGLRGEAPEEGFQGHTIQPVLTGLLARQAGVELAARESPERVELIARSPRFAMS